MTSPLSSKVRRSPAAPERVGRGPVLNRRQAALGGAAAVLATAATGRAWAADTLTMRMEWTTSGNHAPYYLAIEKGWFRNAGIDLSMEDGTGSTTTVQLVGGGQFDVGLASLAPMAMGQAKGLPVTSIAGFGRKGDTGFLVPKGSGWTRPSDLIGKKVVYTAGSVEGPFIDTFFEMNGVPVDKLQLLNVDAASKYGTYFSHQADAMVTSVPGTIPIATGKRDSDQILFADFGMNLPGFGLVVQKDALYKKADVLRRFASVVCGAWTYILDGHEEEASQVIFAQRPKSTFSAPMMAEQVRLFRPYFYTEATRDLPIGIQSETDWKATLAVMEKAGTLPSGTKPGNYFSNDLIDVALVKKIAAGG